MNDELTESRSILGSIEKIKYNLVVLLHKEYKNVAEHK